MFLTFLFRIQDLRVIQVVANLVSKAYLEIQKHIPQLKHSRRRINVSLYLNLHVNKNRHPNKAIHFAGYSPRILNLQETLSLM